MALSTRFTISRGLGFCYWNIAVGSGYDGDDIDLTSYFPLTPDSQGILLMIYPELTGLIPAIKAAYALFVEKMSEFKRCGRSECFYCIDLSEYERGLNVAEVSLYELD